jgi:hypothetical protein
MVKRRNSQYAPHDRQVATRVHVDFTPQPSLGPPGKPLPRAARRTLWSVSSPNGAFFI